MVYGTVAKVKERLQLGTDTYDTEIGTCLTESDAWIDEKLDQYTDVPITSPDAMIQSISNDMAAGIFCQNHRGEYEKLIGTFDGRASDNLQSYINTHYFLF